MADPHYIPSGYPRRKKPGSSQFMRDEFDLIEVGIDAMDRYTILTEHRDANNNDKRYIVTPWDCIVTRVGFVCHETVISSSLQAWWGDSTQSTATAILLADPDSTDGRTLTLSNASPAGSRRSSLTVDRNTFSAGDVISCRVNNPVGSTLGYKATSFIELQRTA